MPVIKAIVEYDGTDFHGFQIQPSTRTVQGVLESAVAGIFQEQTPRVIGSGRTDAGVHATGQVVSFSSPDGFPLDKICAALNSALPSDVRIRETCEAPETFHPRRSAKSRKYVYIVLNRETPSVFLTRYMWQLQCPLHLAVMKRAGSELIGTHDFASFGMPDKPGLCTVRRVLDIRIGRRRDAVILVIRANAFLRGMARAIAGTLVEVGRGGSQPEEIHEILEAHDRQAVRVIAPPQGLYLTKVEY